MLYVNVLITGYNEGRTCCPAQTLEELRACP